jgi:capsular exopolysaccharide synthesis family protein
LAIQLIAELGQMQSTQAQMSLEHPAEWPGLKKSAARIGLIKSKMESKIRSDLMRLSVEEKALGDLLEEYKIELNEYPETERKLAGFQRETQALEDIYTLLLSRLHDSAIAEKAAVSAIEVVDSAIIPIKPILPRPLLFSAIAAILGALLGMVVVISREASIKPVLNARQLERVTGYAQVGVIPNFRKGRARSKGFGGIKRFGIDRNDSASFLALRDAPNSPVAEAFRALRANLPFLREGNPLKTICITSAGKGEGKSTTTADLAIALAQSGKSVLLIDADLRQPTQHKFFDVPLKGGLSEMLGEEENGDPSVRQTDIKNLSLIAAGAAVPNPGDLLPNGKMVKLLSELSQQYDNILLDVPPLLSVADASSFLCEVDGVFLLCRADFLPERLASAASKRLLMLKAPVLGCILNGFCPPHNSGYGDGFAYGAARYANRPPSS